MKQERVFEVTETHVNNALDWITEVLTNKEFSLKNQKKIRLAMEEALVNILHYAYPEENRGKVAVIMEETPESITFTVVDQGIPFNPLTRGDTTTASTLENTPLGGLGIFFMKHVMDDLQYQRKENRNILTLSKKKEGK